MCCLAARHSLIHPLPISQAAARRQQRAEELATRSSATSPPPRAVESSGGDAEISSSLRSFCRSLDPTSTGTVPIDVLVTIQKAFGGSNGNNSTQRKILSRVRMRGDRATVDDVMDFCHPLLQAGPSIQ